MRLRCIAKVALGGQLLLGAGCYSTTPWRGTSVGFERTKTGSIPWGKQRAVKAKKTVDGYEIYATETAVCREYEEGSPVRFESRHEQKDGL